MTKTDVIMQKLGEVSYNGVLPATRALKRHFKYNAPDVSREQYIDAAQKTNQRGARLVTPILAAEGGLLGGMLGTELGELSAAKKIFPLIDMVRASGRMPHLPEMIDKTFKSGRIRGGLIGGLAGAALLGGAGALGARTLKKQIEKYPREMAGMAGAKYDFERAKLKGRFGDR